MLIGAPKERRDDEVDRLAEERVREEDQLRAGLFAAPHHNRHGRHASHRVTGLEHGIFIDWQDPGVATGTFINRNHLAGYLEMCLAAGVGLMLAELSSTRAAGWRDSARQLLRTLLGNKARVRLALVEIASELPETWLAWPVWSSGELARTPFHSLSCPTTVPPAEVKAALVIPPGLFA